MLKCGDDQPPIVGILVRGDLTIDGALLNWQDDFGPFLQVEGNLPTRAMATEGSRVYVGGNLITGDLVGVYDHGQLEVGGTLTARVVATEHRVESAGVLNAHRYDGWASKVYEVRDSAAHTDNPAAPGKVKSQSIVGKDMRMLPSELFAFRALEKLDLTQNKLRELPARLGELSRVRRHHLRGNGLQRLPESIGDLSELEYPYSYVRASFGSWQKEELAHDHPQIHIDEWDAIQHDVDRIRVWFDNDEIDVSMFYDRITDKYDFVEVHALVRLLMRINIPTAAPYDRALSTFEKQSDDLLARLNWNKQATEPMKRLFQSLAGLLDSLAEEYPDNALVLGLRPIFEKRA